MMDSNARTCSLSPQWEPEKIAVSSAVRPYFRSSPRMRMGRAWMGLEALR